MSNNKLVREIHRRWHFNATASVRFLDLYHFTKLVKDNTVNHMLSSLCSEVMDAVNETIVSMKKIPGDTQYGLSIYFPPTKYNYNTYPGFGSSLCLYEDLCFSDRTSWDEFIKEYLHV
jgi:hypothetical protein